MKKITKNILPTFIALAQLTLGLCACSDSNENNEPNPNPDEVPAISKIEVTAKSSTSLSFAIVTTNAVECTWELISFEDDDESTRVTGASDMPDISDITLDDGNKTTVVNDTAKITVNDLDPNTEYLFVASATGKTGKTSKVSYIEVTTDEANSDGIEFERTVVATYTESGTLGDYAIVLALGEIDENGMPGTTSSMMMQLDLLAEADEDPYNATLPEGTYKPGKDGAFSFNPQYTYATFRTAEETDEDDGLTMSPLTSGEITVARDGDIYDITIDGILLSGDSVKAHFQGSIAFTYTSTSQYEDFEEDQDVTLEHEQGRYWGNFFYPHCDDFGLTFYSGTVDENGSLADGYYLYIPGFMPKLADYNVANPPLAAGTYKVRPNKSPIINWVPFEIMQGSLQTVLESETVIGAYLMRVDGATGKSYLGLVDNGTMEVKEQGEGYSIDFNFQTPEGVKLHATYNGTVVMTNYNDNDTNQNNVKRPWSQLDGNVNLNFHSSAEATAFFLGEDMKEGYNSWRIDLVSTTETYQDDYLTLELLTPVADGQNLKECEYTVSDELEGYQLIPGFQTYGGGEVAYCWYGDMNTIDSEGYCTKLAPIYGGTMQVKKNSNTNYTFTFDFIDDNNHTIKGTWTGTTNFYDATQASAKEFSRRLAHQKVVKPAKLLKFRK